MFDANGLRTRITDLNPQLARFTFSKPELFSFFNADGERLGALLYKPAGLGPTDKVPVITWIYEKLTPALHRFDARDQMFISHGYAMLMPNVKVKVGQTADSFEKCVVPAVNAVREMGFTNGKFGLWGHSFGAYATSNLITRTDIFAAAVSGATPPELFRNWASGRDRDSRNIETGQARMGGSPFEFRERYLSQSAFYHLDKVNTPVLILHGEKDLTILFGEGEMMFYALRQLGKTAEFVAYANGDHSLSRHSRIDALDVNRRILEWFERYLKPAGGSRSQP
jgi:dipeptidyl aminopeptidase/acylaminoacyl peptidase